MALAPARLLLPVRAVESPHSSALSSASICSAAGAYPHFSLFFFHPAPSHRSSFSVSASVLEAQNYRAHKQSGHSHSRRQLDEAAPFDDLQALYAEDEGHLGHPHRELNGRARSASRVGRGDGNGSGRVWESSNYRPWKKHGVSQGEVKVRYNKPLGSQGRRNESSWSSNAEDEAGGMYPSLQQDRRSRKFGSETRDMESKGYGRHGSETRDTENKEYVRGGNTYSGNTPWQRQGNFFQQGAPRFDTSRQGNSPDTRSSWKSGRYQEERGNVAWRPQRQYIGDSEREKRNPQRIASPDNGWGANTGFREEFQQQSDNFGSHLKSSSYSPTNGAMELQPLVEGSCPMHNNVNEGRWKEGEKQQQKEVVDRHEVAKMAFKGEPEQENSSITGVSPISRIMQRLRNVDDRIPRLRAREGVQSRNELADNLDLPSAREYLSDRSMPQQSAEQFGQGAVDTRFPWEREELAEEGDSTVTRARRLRPLSSAELTIPYPELRRLRILAVHLKQRVKIGKHGVTNDLVSSIHQRFRSSEVVKVKCEGPPAGNMKKTLEALEEKTGGLIIWKTGSAAVLYRGQSYGQPVSEIVDELLAKKYQSLMASDGPQEVSSRAGLKYTAIDDGIVKEGNLDSFDDMEDATAQLNSDASLDDASGQLDSGASLDNASKGVASRGKTRTLKPEFEKLEEYAMEVEDILKDLGPRYQEWTGLKPVPVDADLLPSSIPNYTPPYRLLPFGTRPNISNTLATHLRRLSRPLAPHFVIGRDRGLQGLAAAMVKLWEKSEIAKIGVKRGILNTNHEIIAEDLKQLTGGFFLCRDKYSMTFFRGKDFLPQEVSAALAERQTMVQDMQAEEERGRADGSINVQSCESSESLPTWVHIIAPEEQVRLRKEAAKARRVQVVAHLERKVKMALEKKEKAGKELQKVEEFLNPVAPSDDKEILTDEERFMLRKLGLKMKAFLLVGRRGVFSGVVQNMHLHWKHRELVKIVIKERDPVQLNETAKMLEAESGGTLISVDPTSKGFAIVVYRGKNYTRPPELRPPNLLTKRLALRRSLEIQRRASLSRHIQGLEQEIAHYRAGLNKMKILQSSEDSVVSEKGDDAQDALQHVSLSESQPKQVGSTQGQTEVSIQGSSTMQGPLEDDERPTISKLSRRKLENMCEIGPIFKAVRLSKTERHAFRNEVLNLKKAAPFLVGRSNPLSTIAKAIRLYFLDHAFVKIGVSYRPRGTSVQDVVEELEDMTGGTSYAQDDFKVILYRGWPSGEDMPLGGLFDVLSIEQCDILEEEEDEEDEGDKDEDEEEEDETMMESTLVQTAVKSGEEESDEDEEVKDKKILQLNMLSDDEDFDDGKGVGELKPGYFLVRKLEGSSSKEEVDKNLFWDRFSDGNDDESDDSDWKTLDGSAGDEDDADADDSRKLSNGDADSPKLLNGDADSRKLSNGDAVEDGDKGGDYARACHEHMESSFIEEINSSADCRSKKALEDVEVDCGSFLAGAWDDVDEGEMALDFDLDEDV